MTNARLGEIKAQALKLHKRLNTVRLRWAKVKRGRKTVILKFKLHAMHWLRRQDMPRVTLEEHKWLCANRPKIAGYCRVFEYEPRETIQDWDMPTQARPPRIREIWVGARSLGAAQMDDLPEAGYRSSMQAEDALEMTDLATYLYADPRTGVPMIEDPDTGKLRPVEQGDMITIAMGSNENLDAWFLDEPLDPRQMEDYGACGKDHAYTDRYSAPDWDEAAFENERGANPRLMASNRLDEKELGYQLDDLEIRRRAQKLADAHILKACGPNLDQHPEIRDQRLKITDQYEAMIRRKLGPVKFEYDEATGKQVMTGGYFAKANEYFANIENIHLRSKRWLAQLKRIPPAPMDWGQIRNRANG